MCSLPRDCSQCFLQKLYQLGGAEFEPLPHHLGVSLTCFIIGNWLHHSADVQKYFVLRARRGLITDGFFSRCRNPNYLGEMMIYGSFASMVLRHPCWWFPWASLTIVWSCLFYPSWLAKDASMSRYPEWPQYTAVSGDAHIFITRSMYYLSTM